MSTLDITNMTAADMLAAMTALQQSIRGKCPELVEETVTDDGETYQALRCPTCGHLVDDGAAFYAVDVSERWNSAEPDHDGQEIDVSNGDDDYGSTLYYLHDAGDQPHPVVPPMGWRERWT